MADGGGAIRIDAATAAELLPPVDVVYFAGLGGSSEAYRMALGKDPDCAINHWDLALSVHQVNHPDAETHVADVFDVDCRAILPGRRWRSAWFSPDCRHFSPAKGAVPVNAGIRGLAWVAVHVAKLRAPDVIFLENVPEFLNWGPLVTGPDGKTRPDPKRKGETFRLWKRRLEQCGYVVEWKVELASDFGAPTIRKRLFLIARRDGRPIVWTAPMYARPELAASTGRKPWKTAAEHVIDWSQPVYSIFLSKEEVRASGLRIKRPLEEATLRRIAKGVRRYVIEAADPFIVPVTHQGDDRCHDIREPLRTVTGANRGELALVAPAVVRTDMRRSNAGCVYDPREPLRTATSGGGFGVASCLLTKFSENSTGHLPSEPLHTVMAGAPRHGLVAAFLEQANTDMVGHDLRKPVSTIVGKGCTQRLAVAHLSHFYGQQGRGDAREPLQTVTGSGAHHGLVTADLVKPFADHGRELRAFLVKYYGMATAQDVADPLHTATARARFGLVLVRGEVFQIADIGMRMLTPDELKLAQGFRPGYRIDRNVYGQPVTRTDQNYLVGNSVSPEHAQHHIAANLGPGAWGSEERLAA